mmetsp:Transcript_55256/g.140088  ORF Transcript_55256/g.140088 Transcript_55256/m.140088 type:complete len:202 (-) Transcript_55256:849-1454(-)
MNRMIWHCRTAHREVVRDCPGQRDDAQQGGECNHQPGKTQHAVEPSHIDQDQNSVLIRNYVVLPGHPLLFVLCGGDLLDVVRVCVLPGAAQGFPKGPPRTEVRIHCIHHKHCACFPQSLVVFVQSLVQVEAGERQERIQAEDVARADGEDAALDDAAYSRSCVLARVDGERVGQRPVAVPDQALDGFCCQPSWALALHLHG